MTEYTFGVDDKKLEEVSNSFELNAYFRQAQEEIKKYGTYGVTYLPISEEYRDIGLFNLGNKGNDCSEIMKRTLMETFEQGNLEHSCNLICDAVAVRLDYADDKAWKEVCKNAINEYSSRHGQWFGQLKPEAQFAAISVMPSMAREARLDFDPHMYAEGESRGKMFAAAGSLLAQAYTKQYDRWSPVKDSPISWDIKVKALEALICAQGNDPKVPAYVVLADLMTEAKTGQQVKRLTDLIKNTPVEGMAHYDNANKILAGAALSIPSCYEAQEFFYNVMHKLGVSEGYMNLPYNAPNESYLRPAKEECLAQRIVDDLAKKDVIENIERLDLVEKYRPEFLRQPQKMSPELCDKVLNSLGHTFPVQTKLEFLTKIIEKKGISASKLAECIDRALELNTSSRAMAQFLEKAEPIVEKFKSQYSADKQFLEAATKAQNEKDAAEKECKLFDNARTQYCNIDDIRSEIKQTRDKAGLKEPSDEVLSKFMEDGLAGKETSLSFEPKSGVGAWFMGRGAKEAQTDIADMVNKLNEKMKAFAQTPEFIYAKEVSGTKEEYIEKYNEKSAKRDKARKNFDDGKYMYSSAERDRAADFERTKVDERFERLTTQFKERYDEVQKRARTDLTMQFGGQEFNGKPMNGLVKEEEMAQGIYQEKIAELRKIVGADVRQDMQNRGVYQKPDIDHPNETGKPMTPESTKKIRNDMKTLKIYEEVAQRGNRS